MAECLVQVNYSVYVISEYLLLANHGKIYNESGCRLFHTMRRVENILLNISFSWKLLRGRFGEGKTDSKWAEWWLGYHKPYFFNLNHSSSVFVYFIYLEPILFNWNINLERIIMFIFLSFKNTRPDILKVFLSSGVIWFLYKYINSPVPDIKC